MGVPDLGTASLITGVAMQDDYLRQLPDWPDEGTDSSLRDTQVCEGWTRRSSD